MKVSVSIQRGLMLALILSMLVGAVVIPGNSAFARPSYGVFTDCSTQTQISQAECNALVALYDNTKGSAWTTRTDWLKTNTPCSWYGVTCSTGKTVIALKLKSNNLAGTLPTVIGNLKALRILDLSHNKLIGGVPPKLGSLTQLVYLNLGFNKLSSGIPDQFAYLANLVTLDLSNNQLSGSIPAVLGMMKKLTNLSLQKNLFSGSIPAQVGALSNLVTLDLHSNKFAGSIPLELGVLINLKYLDLSSNVLTGAIPLQLRKLVNLGVLDLSDNTLSGSIPTDVGYLVQLTRLDLSVNQLTGSIPTQIGTLVNLTSMDLSANKLTGDIPAQIGNLVQLTSLNLSSNQLTGDIPSQIGTLTQLTSLNLSSNQLAGDIPTQIGNLTQLTLLDLSSNKLANLVPAGFGNLTNLIKAYLDGNLLSGDFPVTITNLASLTYFSYDCTLTSPNVAVSNFLDPIEPWVRVNCEAPFKKLSPPNGATNRLTDQTLSWETSTGAGYYEYCLKKTDAPCTAAEWTNNGAATSVNVTALDLDTTYFWQVRAYHNGGYVYADGAKTAFWSFTTRGELTVYSIPEQDGYVLENTEFGGIGDLMNSTNPTLRLGDSELKQQYRSILSFDTSVMSDNSTVSQVILKVKVESIVGGGNPASKLQGILVEIKKGSFGNYPTLESRDWQAGAHQMVTFASPVSVGGWYTFDLTSLGQYINTLFTGGGVTQIRLRFKLDDNNDNVANYLNLYSGDATDPANHPSLYIVYYGAP
jgi:Leucine-rich repeat (LRR) protein